MRSRGWIVLVAGLVLANVGGMAASAGGEAVAPTTEVRPADPSAEAKRMERELLELSRAWADGGGTFGYPFWEKASQRWSRHEIPASIFREYVTGYRDRLVIGCELLRAVETTTDQGESVQELSVEACEQRVEGLRAQQQWLNDLIARDAIPTDSDEAVELDGRISELQEESRNALQSAWRNTRLAMDLAQSELDAAGVERLPEDAFV